MQLSKHLFYTETKNIMNRAILVQLFFTVLVFIQLNLYSCSLRSWLIILVLIHHQYGQISFKFVTV